MEEKGPNKKLNSELKSSMKKVQQKEEHPKKKLFIVSSSPHMASVENVPKIMWSVIVALMPTVVFAVYYFGFHALLTMGVSILAAVLTEAVINKMRKRELTIGDGSAV
ncbi:MAG: RnfABCDGE type electron transport complex subunit D, partial [Candidatus Marinimicrobia bacterium]|nr:RnfABCDGE type electron transport complex subunit D [Candidatus Neomarinimicrobiota bacterium]